MSTFHMALSTGGSGTSPYLDVEADSLAEAIETAEKQTGRRVIFGRGESTEAVEPYNPLDGLTMRGAWDVEIDARTGREVSKFARYGFGDGSR